MTAITIDPAVEPYDNPEFIVSVLQSTPTHRGFTTEYSVMVLFRGQDGVYREVEEVGEATALRELLIDAARIIRTGTAVKED